MLKATDEEIEDVREYFEWQAPDLEVTFMQKVYSEVILPHRIGPPLGYGKRRTDDGKEALQA